jgi:hypothetical protein
MRQRLRRLGGIVIALSALVLPVSVLARTPSDAARVRAQLAGVRLPFIENQGQVDARVAYYAPTFAGTLFVTRQGELVYALGASHTETKLDRSRPSSSPGWSLTETLLGGRPRPAGHDRSTTGVSVFLGDDPARWRSALPTWEQVSLGEVWPGITVALRAQGRSMEKVFTVHPGGMVERIRVRVAGAQALAVDAGGALVAHTGLGAVTFTAPVAYQERDGVRRPVAVVYRHQGLEYGFTVGVYDPGLPLVIDPLLQSTYLGGGDFDEAFALAIHPTTGDIYVAGDTNSNPFPGTAGGAQPAFGGGICPFGPCRDVFIARLPSTLTALTQATYLGGSGDDRGFALAIHPTTGDVYVAGITDSNPFPGTAGGAQPSFGGVEDAFVARLPSTLTALTQATYLGGSFQDRATALAIHPTTGDVYVVGITVSSPFPGTAGGAQPAIGGVEDTFVARFPSTLTSLTQATYLGGNSGDLGAALAIHPTSGDVYVAGGTGSTNFPGTAGGAQPALVVGGGGDAFIARFPSTLTSLTQATYLGGSGFDQANALTIHPTTGDVYVAGRTNSANFPGTAGGAQPVFGGGFLGVDVFVARLPSTLMSLTQATYLGGTGIEAAFALAIRTLTGDVYVAGATDSSNFPGTAGGVQPALGGGGDAFIARLSSTLTSLTQATYLGGSGADRANALAIHPTTGDIYVAGSTNSSPFPGTAGGAQPAFGGGAADGFVTRLTFDLALVAPVPSIPTLSESVMLAMIGLLLVTGLLAIRRRRWAQ